MLLLQNTFCKFNIPFKSKNKIMSLNYKITFSRGAIFKLTIHGKNSTMNKIFY